VGRPEGLGEYSPHRGDERAKTGPGQRQSYGHDGFFYAFGAALLSVILCRSAAINTAGPFRYWLGIGGASPALDATLKLPGIPVKLEQAFEAIRETWWRLGRDMAGDPGGDVSHTAAAGAYGSDFGVMLAWGSMVGELAAADDSYLVICDDPWLFRHVAELPRVSVAGSWPSLWQSEWRLAIRGLLARIKVALTAATAALKLRSMRKGIAGGPTLLVYGHPSSDAAGHDAYFGDLLQKLPNLSRMLHTDCPPAQARMLAADGRTSSLHAWGHPLHALRLLACRWRPSGGRRRGRFKWLIRRAAALENGGGGPAMNRWQAHCQERWLSAVCPPAVAWPWENHAWERALCRAARGSRVRTIGYQHTVIGPHQINYAAMANRDGLASLPDVVVANGPAYRDELLRWGIPADRLLVGGAFRFPIRPANLYNPQGPVFVPLSAIRDIARLQIEAAKKIGASGRQVLVKEHPMYPLPVQSAQGVVVTTKSMQEQKEGLSAVLYSTGTSGLEALFAGLPTYRLLPEDRVAINVLAEGLVSRTTTVADLPEALRDSPRPDPVPWDSVLAPVDLPLWRRLLNGDMEPRAVARS